MVLRLCRRQLSPRRAIAGWPIGMLAFFMHIVHPEEMKYFNTSPVDQDVFIKQVLTHGKAWRTLQASVAIWLAATVV